MRYFQLDQTRNLKFEYIQCTFLCPSTINKKKEELIHWWYIVNTRITIIFHGAARSYGTTRRCWFVKKSAIIADKFGDTPAATTRSTLKKLSVIILVTCDKWRARFSNCVGDASKNNYKLRIFRTDFNWSEETQEKKEWKRKKKKTNDDDDDFSQSLYETHVTRWG